TEMNRSLAIHPNSDVPAIQHVPPEILLEVVCYYAQPRTYLRDLVGLTLVCRWWRIIIEGAAFLWGTINAAEGTSVVRTALQKAKDTLLDLTFDEHTANTTREVFFKLVGERIGRWRSFVVILRSGHWGFVLEDIKKDNAPNLETLQLSGGTGGERGDDMVTLLGGLSGPPGLKDLTLAHIQINIAPLQLGGLRSLTLEETLVMSSAEMVDIIMGSPEIKSIRLHSLEFWEDEVPSQQAFSHPDGSGNPSTQLASLIHLSLHDIPYSFLNRLLLAIDAPQLQTLEVGCAPQEPQAAQLLLEGLHHHRPTLARLTADAQTCTLTFPYRGNYKIIIGGLRIMLDMYELPVDHSQETIDRLFSHLGTPVKDLPFHLELLNWESDVSHLEWLAHRITVTSLNIYSHPRWITGLKRLLGSLSQPTVSDPVIWLFPQVEVIKANLFWLDDEGPDFVTMIKNRHSAKEEEGVTAPKSFREVWVSGAQSKYIASSPSIVREVVEEVRRVANDADVYWEQKKLP
ncbi:hypothetical protein FRC01_000686, partial [Tulasnella sp. 417]